MNRRGVGCSWCHRIAWTTDATFPDCPACGHRADRPRLACDCDRCSTPTWRRAQRVAAQWGSYWDPPTSLSSLRDHVARKVFVDGDGEAL